jgi:hypothetical protein
VENVGHGIDVGGSHSLIERNVVNRFTHDGMRGNGDYNVFQYNPRAAAGIGCFDGTLGADGAIGVQGDLATASATTHLLVDVFGYFE